MTPFGLRKRLKKLVKNTLGMDDGPPSSSASSTYTPTPSSGPARPTAGTSRPSIGAEPGKPASTAPPAEAPASATKAAAAKPAAKKPAAKKAPAKKAAAKKAPAKKGAAKKAPAKSAAAKKAAADEPASTGAMWVQAGRMKADEVVPGSVHQVEIFGARFALYNVDGVFHATADACPHAGGPLGEGDLDGFTITCPFHSFEYDIRSGACTSGADLSVEVVPVKVKNNKVLVRIAA